ncbi:MAG: UDP-3-O-(3-hydroxymyristoyl)glucosamine N-acyltransferase [Flavobacteriales bacterium]|nr:UDP-3-O-(3-hydroxymyristoyl)glucosamine N-acyltransferase [Flavobacteriales bacterium]
MQFPEATRLEELAQLLGLSFLGDPDHQVTGLNEIHRVEKGDLVFVDHPKYYDKALECAATTVLINKEVEVPEGKGLLISDDPFRDYNKLARHYRPNNFSTDLRGKQQAIAASAQIHSTAVIGERVVIGERTVIGAGVVISNDVVVGDDCIIHANTVIGGDAFYYKRRPEGYDKMHTCGGVELGDKVEIGALCTIDRGVSAVTRVGSGSKLDNQVHIGHDTLVGQHCLFAAQVGIAGCVQIEDEVTLWGQVGVPSDLTIGKGAVVLGQSGVTKDLEGGVTYFGSPAEEARHKFRELAMIRKIPELVKKLR